MIPVEILQEIGWHTRNPLGFHFQWQTDVVAYASGITQANQAWSQPVRYWSISYGLMEKSNRDRLVGLFNRMHGRFNPFLFLDRYDHTAICAFVQMARAITAVSLANRTFSVAGNVVVDFPIFRQFQVVGGANAGTYEVTDCYYSGGVTVITVLSAIPVAVVAGSIFSLQFQLYKRYYGEYSSDESWDENKKFIVPASDMLFVDGVERVRDMHYTVDNETGIVSFVTSAIPANEATIEVHFEFYFLVTFTTDSMESYKQSPTLWSPTDVQLVEAKRQDC